MNVSRHLLNYYWKLQKVLAPTLKSSQILYEDVLKSNLNPQKRWLDIGCGHHILASWRFSEEKEMVAQCKNVVGIDYCMNSLKKHRSIKCKTRGDISRLPFKDDTFDLITANMVVEHLKHPQIQFKKISRILKPGGLFIFHTPNKIGYKTIIARMLPDFIRKRIIALLEGRMEEDIFHTYYKANSARAVNKLADSTSFELMNIKRVVTIAECALIPPLALIELVWIRLLMTKTFRALRPNIIVVLRKKPQCNHLNIF